MNALRNSIQLVGRLGIDPVIKATVKGSKMAQLRLATNEVYKNAQGEWVENVLWHNLVVWGSLTQIVEQRCAKGTQIMIEGMLTYRDYEDKEGQKKVVAEVKVRQLQVLDKNKSPKNNADILHEQVEQDQDLPF
ncbi:single-strand binding family protein [Sphingobacterium spiritivorum ATCC 33300]|uniref:Single-stranded DNA-binding protein n=1 Tax=Sphingobacterium spiritivorum ATCC 33300 TaxID=525372 RepID=C2FUG8_SPHSI|nr:single-stranded DNA-binding protein [Sphingobacterium spiritivorum]EEI93437.1 single-strand binding family protein [Sphingobacterium spiritivorum ATCC 33300]QQS95885.1 single-stranded DNA-binding protein [Sphingobacterium spiritivorum]